LQIRRVHPGAISALDAHVIAERHRTAEQYKRQTLYITPGDDDRALAR
jgi:hypothetical protein